MNVEKNTQTVVVLGASDKPERYAHIAVVLLKEQGYRVILVHPTLEAVEGLTVVHALEDIHEAIDTLSIYINPDRSREIIDDIVELKPKRVILNPGAESVEVEKALEAACIPYHHACTVTLLRTGQF